MSLKPVQVEYEEWRDVPGLPDFMASSWGRVIKKPTLGKTRGVGKRVYTAQPTFGSVVSSHKGAKHKYMSTYYKGVGNLKVHRVVCAAFHGPAPFPRAVVIHINEDAYDNRPSNLKWGTQKENLNAKGFLEYCRSRTGENSPTVKGRVRRGVP